MRILIIGNYDLGLYKFRRELLEELVNRRHEVFASVPDGEIGKYENGWFFMKYSEVALKRF